MSINSDTQANTLYASLTSDAPIPPTVDLSGVKFNFTPDTTSDLYTGIVKVTTDELTEVSLTGNGVYDKLMSAVDIHIQREFKGNRLTGDQYAKVYTEVITSVLAQSTQFLLNRDQARWGAVKAQMDARISEIKATEALIQLEKTKVETQTSIFNMQNANANYGLTKLKLANTDADYHLILANTKTVDYKNTFLLPIQLGQEQHKLNFQLPAQTNLLNEQKEVQRAQTLDNRSDALTPVTGLLGRQRLLIQEQGESERAKTLNDRTDAVTVVGSIGKQKDLYSEQIQSFIKDAKFKTAKMYLDGWITQKTLDEGLVAPVELQNATVDTVLESIRLTNTLI